MKIKLVSVISMWAFLAIDLVWAAGPDALAPRSGYTKQRGANTVRTEKEINTVQTPLLEQISDNLWGRIKIYFEVHANILKEEWNMAHSQAMPSNDHWSVFFYEGKAYKSKRPAIVFEFTRDFTRMRGEEVKETNTPPARGTICFQSHAIAAWRSVDFSDSPPNRILVMGTPTDLDEVRNRLKEEGLDIPVVEYSEESILENAYYHTAFKDELNSILHHRALLSRGELRHRVNLCLRIAWDLFVKEDVEKGRKKEVEHWGLLSDELEAGRSGILSQEQLIRIYETVRTLFVNNTIDEAPNVPFEEADQLQTSL